MSKKMTVKRIITNILWKLFQLVMICAMFASGISGAASAAFAQIEKENPSAKLNVKKVAIPERDSFTFYLKNERKHVAWSVSNPKILKIEYTSDSIPRQAVITGLNQGKAKLTARVGKEIYTSNVQVVRPSLIAKKVDPLGNLKIEYHGKSGSGYVTWKNKLEYELDYPQIARYAKSECIEAKSLANSRGLLKNGDKVKFVLYYDKKAAADAEFKIRRRTRTITIKNLSTVPDHDESTKRTLMSLRPDADSVWLKKKSAAAVVLEKGGYSIYSGRYTIGMHNISWKNSAEKMSIEEAENYLNQKGYEIL